jgi:hypothetical protein
MLRACLVYRCPCPCLSSIPFSPPLSSLLTYATRLLLLHYYYYSSTGGQLSP